jgi:GNAT superfamily N-acetyltransferase
MDEKEQIALLWQVCFGERREAVDYFLKHVFAPENCLIHAEDNRVVAMVHMLPAHLVGEGGMLQAHYIYAAATDPAYRSRGLMARLLEEAFCYGEKRGDVCSFLLPSEPSLYEYYGRHGYVPYFKTRFVEIDTTDLPGNAAPEDNFKARSEHTLTSPELARRVRDAQLSSDVGSILWPASHLDYAAEVNGIYGGRTASLCDTEGALAGYALHNAAVDDCVEVNELFATKQTWSQMLRYVAASTGATSLKLRLPESSPVLPASGETRTFGMARPLGRFILPRTLVGRSPYLGLPLD